VRTGGADCLDLRVGAPDLGVEALGDGVLAAGDDGPDDRVRTHPPAPGLRQSDGAREVPVVAIRG